MASALELIIKRDEEIKRLEEEFEKKNEKKSIIEVNKGTSTSTPSSSGSSVTTGATAGALAGAGAAVNKNSNSGNKYSGVDLSKYSSSFSPSKNLTEIGKQVTSAENAVKNYPSFTYERQKLLDDALEAYRTRDPFKYDVNADALYKLYEDKYMNQGKLAMQDAMGQAQAATGGYGNSYAATVGNQVYQSHVQGLTDVIPELEQNAYAKYNQEGEDLYKKYALLADDRATAYNEHLDGYQKALADRDYISSKYNNEYSKEYGKWSDQYQKDIATLETLEGLLGGADGSSLGGSGGSSGTEISKEDRTEILEAISKKLSGDVFQYDGNAAKDYINGLLYSGTINTQEAKYLWNMSGVGVLTGEEYEVPSEKVMVLTRFMNQKESSAKYSDFKNGTADPDFIEEEIARQYEKGLLSEDDVSLLFEHYGIG